MVITARRDAPADVIPSGVVAHEGVARETEPSYDLAHQIDRESVPGAIVECGVFKGGAAALLAHSAPAREIYLFDSFEGCLRLARMTASRLVDAYQEGWCAGTENEVPQVFEPAARPRPARSLRQGLVPGHVPDRPRLAPSHCSTWTPTGTTPFASASNGSGMTWHPADSSCSTTMRAGKDVRVPSMSSSPRARSARCNEPAQRDTIFASLVCASFVDRRPQTVDRRPKTASRTPVPESARARDVESRDPLVVVPAMAEVDSYRSDDRRAVEALYRRVFGTDAAEASRLRWEWQYGRNPNNPGGAPVIWIAREGPTIVGQYATMPVRLWVGGREVDASWGMDVMVAPERQRQGIGEVLFRTWDRKRGASLGLGLSESSHRLFRSCGGPSRGRCRVW